MESLERETARRDGIEFVVAVFIRFGFERGRQNLFGLACGNDVVVARHTLNFRTGGRLTIVKHQDTREFRGTRFGTIARHLAVRRTTHKKGNETR